MYITEVLTKTKAGQISHRCILLRETYRENGKVKNRTLANLTHCNPQDVAALRLALQRKGALPDLTAMPEAFELKQGPSVGAAWLVYEVARHLRIDKALGTSRAGKIIYPPQSGWFEDTPLKGGTEEGYPLKGGMRVHSS